MRVRKIGQCAFCGDEKVVHIHKRTKKPVCQDCNRKHLRPKKKCGVCGQSRRDVYRHKLTKKPTCSKCYKKHFQPKATCSICGKERIVASYDREKRPICAHCARSGSKRQRCSMCGQKRVVCSYSDKQEPICNLCHHGLINLKDCSQCHQLKAVAKRLPDGGYLCRACVEENSKGICPRCSNERALTNRVDGQLVCQPCKWKSQTAECRTCHKERAIIARGQCGSCYGTDRQNRAAVRIRAMAIGVIVYRTTTKKRGVVIGQRLSSRLKGRNRILKSEICVRLVGSISGIKEFWPAIECRLITHQSTYKPEKQEVELPAVEAS